MSISPFGLSIIRILNQGCVTGQRKSSLSLCCLTRYYSTVNAYDGGDKKTELRTRSEEQAAFIKHWNKENNVIFGPIIKRKSSIKANRQDSVANGSKLSSSSSPVGNQIECDTSPTNKVHLESMLLFPIFSNAEKTANCPLEQIQIGKVPAFGENGEYANAFPGVTTVLNSTRPPESQFYLDQWKKKMINELGIDGFAAHQKNIMEMGSRFHGYIQRSMQGDEDIDVIQPLEGVWKSVLPILNSMTDVRCTESFIRHPYLHYSGAVDCVAVFKNRLCVIDWKKSSKSKPSLSSTFDNPLQIASYVGALNYDDRYDLKVNTGVLVIGYEDGAPADVHTINPTQLTQYWGQWLQRLHCYWQEKISNG